jgi:hypothetical protein
MFFDDEMPAAGSDATDAGMPSEAPAAGEAAGSEENHDAPAENAGM